MCRSRRELSNEYLPAKFGFDTAEKEPCKFFFCSPCTDLPGSGEFGAYSDAMKGSGMNWSEKHLYQFLINPKKYVVGTKMVFAGLKKDAERADLIAFLAGCKD